MTTTILKIALLFFLFLPAYLSAQKLESFQYNDRILYAGDTFQLASGSLNKIYAHIFIDQSKMTANTRIGSQFDGAVVVIKQIRKERVNKKDIVMASLSGMEPFKVKCHLKEALDTHELVQFKKSRQ